MMHCLSQIWCQSSLSQLATTAFLFFRSPPSLSPSFPKDFSLYNYRTVFYSPKLPHKQPLHTSTPVKLSLGLSCLKENPLQCSHFRPLVICKAGKRLQEPFSNIWQTSGSVALFTLKVSPTWALQASFLHYAAQGGKNPQRPTQFFGFLFFPF